MPMLYTLYLITYSPFEMDYILIPENINIIVSLSERRNQNQNEQVINYKELDKY